MTHAKLLANKRIAHLTRTYQQSRGWTKYCRRINWI